MVDVLPEWTVRGVKSSECEERKRGSESQTKCESQRRKGKKTDVFERPANPKQMHFTTTPKRKDLKTQSKRMELVSRK